MRFLTIADFDEFCREKGIRIHQQLALDTEAGCEVHDDPNPTPTWRSWSSAGEGLNLRRGSLRTEPGGFQAISRG